MNMDLWWNGNWQDKIEVLGTDHPTATSSSSSSSSSSSVAL
jgi:hypothetical protein